MTLQDQINERCACFTKPLSECACRSEALTDLHQILTLKGFEFSIVIKKQLLDNDNPSKESKLTLFFKDKLTGTGHNSVVYYSFHCDGVGFDMKDELKAVLKHMGYSGVVEPQHSDVEQFLSDSINKDYIVKYQQTYEAGNDGVPEIAEDLELELYELVNN